MKDLEQRKYPKIPRVGVGVLVFRGEQILLVKRGKPPNAGKWTIPGGLVKLGETLHQAAERELLEECGIKIVLKNIITTFDIIDRDEKDEIRYHYVLVDFAADYHSGNLKADSDVDEARWLLPDQIHNLDMPEKSKELILETVRNRG